jgi:hypothetical protein
MSEVVADLVAKLGLEVNEAEFDKGDGALGSIGETIKKLAVAAAGLFAAHKVADWIGQTIEAGDNATKMAAKMGISAESVQELAYAAGQSGTSIDALSGAMGKLGKGLKGEFEKGEGPMLDALNEIGVSSSEIHGKLTGPGGLDDVLGIIADKFADMPEGMNKGSLAMELFGKSGKDLIPFLNAGSAGIEELRAEANELGVVMSAETGTSLEALGDDWDRVKTSFAGVRNEIVTALLPYLRAAAEQLVVGAKAVVAWVRDHREEIQGVFYAIGKTVTTVAGWISDGVSLIAATAQVVYAMLSTIANALVGLTTMLIEIFQVVLDALEPVWELILKGLEIVGRAFAWIRTQAMGFANTVVSAGRRVLDFFVGVATSIRDAFIDAFDAVVSAAKSVGEAIVDLPVIKQAVEAGKYLGGGARQIFRGASEDSEEFDAAARAGGVDQIIQAPSSSAYSPSAPPHASLYAPKSNTFQMGDINIQAPPGVDAAALASLVESKVRSATGEWWDDQMSHAASTVEEVG